MRRLLVSLGIFAIVLIVGWRVLHSGGTQYEVTHPMLGPAVQAVYATGTVEATVMMPIAARASARLLELNVDEGSEVKKDQVLARLEAEDLQQSVNELKAREEFARQDFERKSLMMKSKAVSREGYDLARSNWEAAKAAVRAAQAQVQYMTLLAPEDGRIIRRDGEIGQLIPANQAVFWLSCCAPLRVSTEVDEEDIALVQPGQKVLIHADAFPGKVFEGAVESITPKGDPIARSYRVRVGFTHETPLLIGMTAETNIIIRETKQAMLVPTGAVVQNGVWLLKDGKVLRAKVEIGAKGVDQTEIVSGVSPNDLVVTNPSPGLLEGQAISAKQVTQSTSNVEAL